MIKVNIEIYFHCVLFSFFLKKKIILKFCLKIKYIHFAVPVTDSLKKQDAYLL